MQNVFMSFPSGFKILHKNHQSLENGPLPISKENTICGNTCGLSKLEQTA